MAGDLFKGDQGVNKIINLTDAVKISKKLKEENKTIVVSGGCFDILHIGHVKFLQEAKKRGDVFFILLENDNTVRKLKGKNRPINPQGERAEVLAALSLVDYVVLLEDMNTNQDYDNLIYELKPNIIATTKNDPQAVHNERQAKKINAKVSYVTNRIQNKSTTLLSKIIAEKLGR